MTRFALPEVSLGAMDIRDVVVSVRRETMRPGLDLTCRASVVSVDDASRRIDVSVRRHLPEYAMEHPGAIVAEARNAVMELLGHEVDEWFRVNGTRLCDPHEGDPV